MIDNKKLKIYKKYKGKADDWVRMGSNREKEGMDDEDWAVIDSLIQDLILIRNGLVSKSFIDAVAERLLEKCNAESTVEIKRLADSDVA